MSGQSAIANLKAHPLMRSREAYQEIQDALNSPRAAVDLLSAAGQTAYGTLIGYAVGSTFGGDKLATVLQEIEPGAPAATGAGAQLRNNVEVGLLLARDPLQLLGDGPKSIGPEKTRSALGLRAELNGHSRWDSHVADLLRRDENGLPPRERIVRAMQVHESCRAQDAGWTSTEPSYDWDVFVDLAHVTVEALEALLEPDGKSVGQAGGQDRDASASATGSGKLGVRGADHDLALRKESRHTVDFMVKGFLDIHGIHLGQDISVNTARHEHLEGMREAFRAAAQQLKDSPEPHSAPRAALLAHYEGVVTALASYNSDGWTPWEFGD